jgi:hypothetical protein
MFAHMTKKRWRERTVRERAGMIALAAAQFALTAWAQRDLSDREHDEVRGPKLVWRVVNMVTVVGPVTYLVAGRKSID